MFPDFSDAFRTIESYRYSITIGLFLLFLAPFFLPLPWGGASGTWQFAAGLMFFLSSGMILTRDVWPLIRRMFGWSLSKEEQRAAARRIIGAARDLDQDGPPFRIEITNDRVKEFVTYNFEAVNCRVEGDEVIITETGLKQMKEHL